MTGDYISQKTWYFRERLSNKVDYLWGGRGICPTVWWGKSHWVNLWSNPTQAMVSSSSAVSAECCSL